MSRAKRAAAAIVRAVRGVAQRIDPKLLATTATAALTWVVVHVGLSADDPAVVLFVPIAVGAIVGWLVPNAASGLTNRWQSPG